MIQDQVHDAEGGIFAARTVQIRAEIVQAEKEMRELRALLRIRRKALRQMEAR